MKLTLSHWNPICLFVPNFKKSILYLNQNLRTVLQCDSVCSVLSTNIFRISSHTNVRFTSSFLPSCLRKEKVRNENTELLESQRTAAQLRSSISIVLDCEDI